MSLSASTLLRISTRWSGRRHSKLLLSSSLRSLSTASTHNSKNGSFLMSKEELSLFHEKGYVNELGLTVFDTLHEMVERSTQVFASRPAFATYQPDQKAFAWMSYQEYAHQVDRCRTVLRDLGVTEHSKVGIISNNRSEWATLAAATYSLNAQFVPMYEAQLPTDWTYIVNDASCNVLFCATQDVYDKVQQHVVPNAPLLQATLCLDAPVGEPYAFGTVMEAAVPDAEKKLVREPTPDDLANLIYTSGTTGKPKGVELTHANFTSNVKAAARTMVQNVNDLIHSHDCSLSFLPWAHSYGQTCELWMSMAHGSGMGICRGVPYILEDLQLIRPTILFAVPTLYKKVYDGVNNLMETATPLRRGLMQRALHLGERRIEESRQTGPPMSLWERLQFKALDSVVLSKIRARFGGRLRHSLVGGAACPAEVLHFMDKIGIPVCEGYGMTETSPIVTMNTPEQRHLGSVGRAIGGVTVYIVDENGNEVPDGQEGEICCVGPNVMRGYHNNVEATKEVMSLSPKGEPRMFHTGDLGRKEVNGFVRVTGRLKEQYKLENGKYVVPTPIEEAIGLSRFISQVVLTGANRPYNVALLVPEWNAIRGELKVEESDMSDDDLANDERVQALLDCEIASTCASLKKFEIPQAWAIVAPFTAANNMLTPKMSIRRHKVIAEYATVIAHLYGDHSVDAKANEKKEATTAAAQQKQQVA